MRGAHRFPYAIATDGKLKTDFIYDEVHAFPDGLIAVKQNGKWGYANAEGKLVIPCRYDSAAVLLAVYDLGVKKNIPIPADCTEGYVVLYNGSEYALYSNQGREVIPFGAFDGLSEVQNGRLWAKQNGVWGILTLKRYRLVPQNRLLQPPVAPKFLQYESTGS